MKLSELTRQALAQALRREGIGLSIGPFSVRLRSRIGYVADSLHRLYADYPLADDHQFHDFHIAVERPRGIRHVISPQALFLVDGEPPFKPLPLNQAYPFFEWGLNWCVAQYAHQFLILHAAVVERDGIAAILPGSPGAGKSTLCASLVARGWRLLSDEMALIPRVTERLVPIPRPVALKNDSIDILKHFAPEQVFGDSFHDTAKGTVAHMKPPAESIRRAGEPAPPRLLIFPRFAKDTEMKLEPLSRGRSFLKAVEYSFNYDFLGADGFRRMDRLISACDCYDFNYPSLEAGLDGLTRLWERTLAAETAP
ncbi:MAG TPA: HprK-related kinase A [Sedimenticola thiotaurini]|uniref:HprK-related kinase A n=1 Tax=Sedimenticola thiotaurini TaxID=1543721 RepID=A0A831RMC8_9GAMM|nr:HprK-related kinase A [Sedimenticola thiotaurini]